MSEQISKFQPNRTMSIRGFDRRGAAAAMHSATSTGFKVSGIFRDQADFAVAMLYDADSYYEHPSMRYLPDFDLTGVTLEFDLAYGASGLQPIDSAKYNWIDWATIDVITAEGEPLKRSLWENAQLQSGSFPAAGATVTFTSSSSIASYDRVSLWYQNYAFDYIAGAQTISVEFQFFAATTGTVFNITVDGTSHNYTQQAGDNSAAVALGLRNSVNAGGGDPKVTAGAGSVGHAVLLTLKTGVNAATATGTGVGSATLSRDTLAGVASNLEYQINTADWPTLSPLLAIYGTASGTSLTLKTARYGQVTTSGTTVTLSGAISATNHPFVGLTSGDDFLIDGFRFTVSSVTSATQLTLTTPPGISGKYLAPRGGRDGNMIEVYALNKTGTLNTNQDRYKFTGGSSNCTWRVSLDFSALGIDQIRQAWITLAPELTDSDAFPDTGLEWEATFSNFDFAADPNSRKWHHFAGPGTVRIQARDAWVERSGTWALQDGFFNQGFALVSNETGAALTIKYSCQHAHDLYLGTSLYSDRGIVSIAIDGGTAFDFDAYLGAEPPVVSRRKITTSQLAAGDHTVTITLTGTKHAAVDLWDFASSGYYFVFDYLEAVANATDTLTLTSQTYANVMPATDYDTDHSYKIPPARLLWNLYGLGFRGQLNHYLGVFWWNQRKRVLESGDLAFRTLTVDFGGTWADGDTAFLTLGDFTMGKSVFPADDCLTIAQHFASFVNEVFVGVWAEALGSSSSATLTITTRSPFFEFTHSNSKFSTAGTMSVSGDLDLGIDGDWYVDETISPVMNRAARDWHADFCAEIAARSNTVVMAVSMEIVNPPDDPGAGKVWAARFDDGTPVTTATGFNSMHSTHCAFMSDVLDYHKEVAKELAGVQATAGLTPWIQYGEFLWWFFDSQDGVHKGMALYDDMTAAAALTALGRPLAYFDTINSSPAVNSYADANFLRSRLKAHCDAIRSYVTATYSNCKFEILYAHDVNYPSSNSYGIGGALNNYINFPTEFRQKSGSGLDRLKMESLSFGAQERNLDKQKVVITFPWTAPNTWSKADCAYLIPIFNAGCPWPKEYLHASDNGPALLNMWAWDHIVLISWPLPLPTQPREARLI